MPSVRFHWPYPEPAEPSSHPHKAILPSLPRLPSLVSPLGFRAEMCPFYISVAIVTSSLTAYIGLEL